MEQHKAIKAQLEYLRKLADKAQADKQADCLQHLDKHLSRLCFDAVQWYTDKDLGY